MREITGLLKTYHKKPSLEAVWLFFLFRCWKHKYIDRWIILAQILFLLYIQIFGNKITTQELGTQDTYTGARKHSFCHKKLVLMKFFMKKHDISLVAIIARQAGRICWQRDWMLLSSVDCFRMIIRRIRASCYPFNMPNVSFTTWTLRYIITCYIP